MQLMQICTTICTKYITKEMFLSVTAKPQVHIKKKSTVQVFLFLPTLKLLLFTPFLLSPKPANLDSYKHDSRIFLGK